MNYILTNEGAALMTKAVAGKDLVFTRAESGNGYSAAPANLSQVIGRQQDLNINVTHEGSDVKIICLLTNYQLEEGYILKQLGVYAKLVDEEDDTLIIIGQEYSGEQIHPITDGEAEYEFTILMKASGTSSITVEGGAGSLALKKDLNAHTNRQDNPHNVTAEQLNLGKVQNASPSDQIPEFKVAENRENIESGEKTSILWGKVKKWLADLGTAAFCSVVNHCLTTDPGTVLDGRVGKILMDAIEQLQRQNDEINSNMAPLSTDLAFKNVTKNLTAKAVTEIFSYTAASDMTFPLYFYLYFAGETEVSNSYINIDGNIMMQHTMGGGLAGYGHTHSYSLYIKLKAGEKLQITGQRFNAGIASLSLHSTVQF